MTTPELPASFLWAARSFWFLMGVTTLAALACLAGPAYSPQWRSQQEVFIAEAVVLDLLQMPPDPHDPDLVPTSFCLFVPEDEDGSSDPSSALLEVLKTTLERVHPISECDMEKWTVSEGGEPSRVAALGILSLEWKSDTLVKVEGARLIGPLAGASWIYTLSHTPRGWLVDTARQNRIY